MNTVAVEREPGSDLWKNWWTRLAEGYGAEKYEHVVDKYLREKLRWKT